MVWLFFVLGAAIVVIIAFVALGQVVGQLEQEHPPAVFDVGAAVDWIADRLPDEVTARLSYEDVGRIVGWHLDWFGEVGVSSPHGEELAGQDVAREGAVAVEEAAVDAVVARSLAEAERNPELAVDAVDVVCVLDLQMRYLAAIGAVGDAVSDPE